MQIVLDGWGKMWIQMHLLIVNAIADAHAGIRGSQTTDDTRMLKPSIYLF